MVGYVLALIPTKKSMNNSRNEYFDMNFQYSEDRTYDIRVMVFKDYPVSQRNFFIDKKNASHPIKLRNVATTPTGMKFFNRASSAENTFSHECFQSKILKNLNQKFQMC